MRRVVVDTSVVVAALRTRKGAGNTVLRLVAERRLQLLATPPLFLEYEDVLKRAEQRLVHGLSLEQVDEFLAELAAHVEPVELHFMWRPQHSIRRAAEWLAKEDGVSLNQWIAAAVDEKIGVIDTASFSRNERVKRRAMD